MKAAVVHDFTQPLVIEERPVPEPGPHQVRVRIEASGLCHTDIHAAHGDWPVRPTPPFVPGHEGVGIVEAAGAEVRHVRVGDRVAVPWLADACGRCDHCVSGWETLCTRQHNSGYSVDGAYAEQALAHGDYVVPVPDGLDPLDAAPLSCAGCHHLQGAQGLRRPRHPCPGLRHRRPRPPRPPVRPPGRCRDRRRRRHRRQARPRPRTRRGPRPRRPRPGRRRRGPEARRCPRRDRPRRQQRLLPGRLRLAAPRRHPRPGRPARRGPASTSRSSTRS